MSGGSCASLRTTGAPEPAMVRSPRGRSAAADRERDALRERLQKVLAGAGLASRREAEAWIRQGRLTVNGEPATLGMRVGPADQIRLDGRLVHRRPGTAGAVAFVYHRSSGESLDQPPPNAPEAATALERLPRRAGRRLIVISPMPRIDGGLELICADGACAARLQRRVRQWISVFSVRVIGELAETQQAGVLGGMLDDGGCLTVLECRGAGGEGTNRWYTVRARGASGKAIRQLFERQGARVSRVLRIQLGALVLGRALPRGHFRALEADQIDALLATDEPAAPAARSAPL